MRKTAAWFLLAVIIFHSFVLVPKANATAFAGALARQIFMGVSPATLLAVGAGVGIVMVINRMGGTDMIAVTSAGVTALKNWLTDTALTPPLPTGTGQWYGNATYRFELIYSSFSGGTWSFKGYQNTGGNWTFITQAGQHDWMGGNYTPTLNDAIAWLAARGGASSEAAPTVPTDYAGPLGGSQPSFPAGSVKGSPGSAGRVSAEQKYGIKVDFLTDAQVSEILDTFNGTDISPEGVQDGAESPVPNDNTMTAGAAQQISLLGQIKNYAWYLMGIGTDTKRIANTGDNSLIVLQEISGKLDNTGAYPFPQAAQNALDNIVTGNQGIQNKIEQLDNTLRASPTSAAVSAVAAKWSGIYDTLMTKFPFSWFSIVPEPSGLDMGETPALMAHFYNTAVDYSPWKFGPINDIIHIIRTSIGLFFWAVCVVGIYRRITLGES